jgi:2-phosphosulfolactate phosphatase
LVNNNQLPKLEVCFSPALIEYYNPDEKIVVVVDILRASSAICAGIANGIEKIIPVETLEEAYTYKNKGYIVAAERQGEAVEGFDFGNSPFSYMDQKLIGKTIVMTTTNCTRALAKAKSSYTTVIGSFVNQKALVNYLINENTDTLLLCAGWKNKFNLEDTLFTGSMVQQLTENFSVKCDSAIAAEMLFNQSKNNLTGLINNSSHALRLKHLDIDKDVDYCFKNSIVDVVPLFNGLEIVNHTSKNLISAGDVV